MKMLVGLPYLRDVCRKARSGCFGPFVRFEYFPVIIGQKKEEKEPIRVEGWHNFFFLAGVVAAVLMSGILKLGDVTVLGIAIPKQSLLRDFLMILMGILSLVSTKAYLREANEFSWFPIKEVAYLFH